MSLTKARSFIIVMFVIACTRSSFLLGQDARTASSVDKPGVARDATAGDELARRFRSIAEQISPSVVSIRVERTVNSPQMQMPDDLRQFFRDFGQGFEQGQNPNGNSPNSNDQNDGSQPMPGFGQPGPMHEIGTGSGVIVDADNGSAYILTNNHVAGGNSEMEVKLSDGRVIKGAKLVGADAPTDLAVVKIDVSGLKAAQLGDSDELKQGDWVLAFGAPFGYVGSMTHGIVSALHRQAGILGDNGYESYIQTDAPINPGNSGGPLVDLQGKVVGINSAIATESGGFQGIGFAVPTNMAKPIYDELKAHGKIVRGWLGLEIASVSDLTDQAKSLGYTGTTGVLVKSVLSSGAAKDKLQPGDIITSLNGKEVEDASELRNSVAMVAPGKDVTLGIVRNGKAQQVQITLGEQPENMHVAAGRGQESPGAESLGMRLNDVNNELSQQYGLNEKTGALVTQVAPNSMAANAGLHAGDLITRINDTSVSSADQARKVLAETDLKKGVRLFVTNRQGSEYLYVRSAS